MKKLIAPLISAALVLMPLSVFAAYDVGLGVNATVGATTGAGAATKVNVDGSGSADVSTQSQGDVKVEVGDDKGMDSGSDTSSEGVVHGDPDFDLFAKTVTTAHAQVSAVDVDSDGSVDVAYKHQGWLFGFIPVTVTSHTTVVAESDGSAKAHVRMPWWSFMVSGVSDIQTKTEAQLNANADVQANAAVQSSTASKVKLTEVMVTALTEVDSAVKASYNVKANVK